MARTLVAAMFRWNEYPGLRVGKLYAGKGDITRRPRGETHAVATPDATETVCGLPRADFPYDFAESERLRDAEPCETCGVVPAEQAAP